MYKKNSLLAGLLSIIPLVGMVILYQNCGNMSGIGSQELEEVTTTLASTTQHRALLSSQIIEKPGESHVGKDYRSYLSYVTSDIMEGDVFIVHALIEGTHQPLPGVDSTATFTSFIACNGIRISPYRFKSLKRTRGNHHGSMVASGRCYVKGDYKQVKIELKAKESLGKGLIHFRRNQTKLIVNHYRSIDETGDLDEYSFVTSSFSAQPSSNFYFQDPNDAYNTKYPLQSIDLDLQASDRVYLTSQGTAEDPNPEIPMFGFSLLANNRQIGVATENPTPDELYRVSQYSYGMYESKTDNLVNFRTEVYALESASVIPRMLSRGTQAHLQGLIFRKGSSDEEGGDRMSLSITHLGHNKTDVNILPDSTPHNVSPSKTFRFEGVGLLRIKAFAGLIYRGTDTRSCFIRIKVTDENFVTKYSTPSGRYLKSPYVYHNLSSEMIFPVKQSGEFTVQPFVYCSDRADKTPVTLKNTASWVFVDQFEAIDP